MKHQIAVFFLAAILLGATVTSASTGTSSNCFESEGFEIIIGDDPGMDIRLHLSLLTSPNQPREFGGEFTGHLDHTEIVVVAAGVTLDDIKTIQDNPISAFSLIVYYHLHLPMFEGYIAEPTFDGDEVIIESAAATVKC